MTGTSNRCKKILETFGEQISSHRLDAAQYTAKLESWLEVLLSKDVQSVTELMYSVLVNYFWDIWEVIYSEKEETGQIKNAVLIGWDKEGKHRSVNADDYLRNWETMYALAENWDAIATDAEKVEMVKSEIRRGISGILCEQDYENAIFITLRDRQREYYRRMSSAVQSTASTKKIDHERLKQELLGDISALPYPQSINFLGELAGAYVLSCSENVIRQYSSQEVIGKLAQLGYTGEELYMMVLLKLLVEYGAMEMRIGSYDIIPFNRQSTVGEAMKGIWKYQIELPKQAIR